MLLFRHQHRRATALDPETPSQSSSDHDNQVNDDDIDFKVPNLSLDWLLNGKKAEAQFARKLLNRPI